MKKRSKMFLFMVETKLFFVEKKKVSYKMFILWKRVFLVLPYRFNYSTSPSPHTQSRSGYRRKLIEMSFKTSGTVLNIFDNQKQSLSVSHNNYISSLNFVSLNMTNNLEEVFNHFPAVEVEEIEPEENEENKRWNLN